jgi:hypothetical protein
MVQTTYPVVAGVRYGELRLLSPTVVDFAPGHSASQWRIKNTR